MVVGGAGYDREEMQQRSTHLAADVLDHIQYCERIDEALGAFHYIVGTTARLGKARGPFILRAQQPVILLTFPRKIRLPSFSDLKIPGLPTRICAFAMPLLQFRHPANSHLLIFLMP